MSFFNDTMYQAFLKNPEQFGFTYEVWKEWYSKQLGSEFKTSFSKKYFTKYLPVEGEIKVGDVYLQNLIGIGFPNEIRIYTGGKLEARDKKVKLFLCSRDITVDDFGTTYHSSEDTLIATENTHWRIKDFGYYKIIGEISPDVTWVKEGAEFSEDEVIPFWRISIETWSSAHKGNNVMDLGSERYPEYFTEGRIKTILQYYCDENYISARTVEKPFVAYYELKGPCGHFH